MKEVSENLDVRELEILNKLESNDNLTQRELSREVGIALGLVNHLLKKMAGKGWIKIKNVNTKKIKYLITPKGAKEKTSLLCKRVESTIHFYLEAKRVIKDKIVYLKNYGVESVSIYGVNHISEVLFIVLKELRLELDHVVDNKKKGDEWFGYKVIDLDEYLKKDADFLILASFNKNEVDAFQKNQKGIKVIALRE